MKVEEILRKLGVNATYMGYKITIAAVEIVKKEPEGLAAITKQVYPECAKKCEVSTWSVERNVRTAARIAWQRNPNLLIQIAGYPMTAPPSAGEFIEMLANATKKRSKTVNA